MIPKPLGRDFVRAFHLSTTNHTDGSSKLYLFCFYVTDGVAILLPTAGENLEVVFKALVGSLSQRLWDSGLPGNETLRVVVLDEKRRLEVYRVAAGVNRIGELLAGRRVQQILMVRYNVFRYFSFISLLEDCKYHDYFLHHFVGTSFNSHSFVPMI